MAGSLQGQPGEEFLEQGAKISGFRAGRRKLAEGISSGEYLIYYLIRISKSTFSYWLRTSAERRSPMRSPAHLRPPEAAPAHDLPPPPLLPSCGGGMEQIGRQNSLPEAEVHFRDCCRTASRREREKDSIRTESVIPALPGFISWDTSYGLQTTIPSTRSKSLSLVAISRIRQRLIADR